MISKKVKKLYCLPILTKVYRVDFNHAFGLQAVCQKKVDTIFHLISKLYFFPIEHFSKSCCRQNVSTSAKTSSSQNIFLFFSMTKHKKLTSRWLETEAK